MHSWTWHLHRWWLFHNSRDLCYSRYDHTCSYSEIYLAKMPDPSKENPGTVIGLSYLRESTLLGTMCCSTRHYSTTMSLVVFEEWKTTLPEATKSWYKIISCGCEKVVLIYANPKCAVTLFFSCDGDQSQNSIGWHNIIYLADYFSL